MDRRRIGWITMIAGGVMALGSMVMQTGVGAEEVPTSRIDLHNATAQVGTECPADGHAYWHFVLAPNGGGYEFVKISLNLDGTQYEFTGAGIVPNGTQMDNVYIKVPAGTALTDLMLEGSFALITPQVADPEDPGVQFVLSHVCEGEVDETTTTTVEETTTTVEETTTTVEETTTTVEESTTTTEPEVNLTTTTTEGGSESPTTTTISESLPPTGSNGSWMTGFGVAMMGFGLVMQVLGRRSVAR